MDAIPPAPRAREAARARRLLPAAVFASAALFRLAAAWSFPVNPLEPDFEEYWVLARGIAERGSYDFGPDWRSNPILAESSWSYLYEEEASLLRPPGYPAALAALQRSVGHDLRRHQAALAVVDGLTALALYRIAVALAGIPAGLCAAALFLASPGTTYNVTRMGREPFLGLFVALGLLASMRALARPSARAGAAAGLAFGIGGYFKETLFGAGAATALFLAGLAGLRRRAEFARPGAALLVVLLALPLPWLGRNAALHGGFVGFTNVSGLATWIGVVPSRWIRTQPADVQTALDHRTAPTAVEANRRLWAQVRAFALAEPDAVAAAVVRNAGLFWSPIPRAVWVGDAPLGAREALSLSFYLGLFGLALAGLVLRRADPTTWLAVWLLLCLTAAHSLTVSFPRYRLPFDVVLLPFAGAALAAVLAHGRRLLARASA